MKIGDRVTYFRGRRPGAVWTVTDVLPNAELVLIVRKSGTFETTAVAGFDEIKLIEGKEK